MFHCEQVVLGNKACLEPFAMAKAGLVLPAGGVIAPASCAPEGAPKKGPQAPVLAALRTELHSEPLSPAATGALQVRATAAPHLKWKQELAHRKPRVLVDTAGTCLVVHTSAFVSVQVSAFMKILWCDLMFGVLPLCGGFIDVRVWAQFPIQAPPCEPAAPCA